MATNAAFEVLYKEFYVRVYGLCRRLLASQTLAEDAAQETFMRAFRHFGRYEASRPFWHWIASIANRHCIDVLRRHRRSDWLHVDDAEDIDELVASHGMQADAEPGMEHALIETQDASALNEAIAQLPDKYRVPLVLAYFHESSYDEIAEELAITRNHVGVLLLRAKQRLRVALTDDRAGGDA